MNWIDSISGLEGCGDRQAEGLARFAEEVLRAVGLDGFSPGVIACSARREEVAGNELSRAALHLGADLYVVAIRTLIQAQRVVRVVKAEGRVDDRHDDRKLATHRHARQEVGSRDGANISLESDLRTRNAALAGAVVVNRASVEGGGERGEAFGALLQLSVVGGNVYAEIGEERERCGTDDWNAVLGIGDQVGIAADRGYAIDRNRHLDALVQLRVVGIARNAGAVRVGQLHGRCGWARNRKV